MFLYEIKYKFLDSLNEDWHDALIVVYDSMTILGETFANALDYGESDGEWDGANKLLKKYFDKTDDDICFYFDIADIKENGTSRWTRLVPEIQYSFDITIKQIDLIDRKD